MEIIAVDDERLALEYLVRVLCEAQPDSHVYSFTDPQDALNFIRNTQIDVAFLDVEMFGINGIAFAKQFKDIQPQINIIFVTGYSEYAVDAFQMHASGYLLKPISVESVQNELNNLRVVPEQKQGLVAQTFGNFEVFYNNMPVKFNRAKSKELLAYLIDRKGAGCTTAELCAVLWENKDYNLSLQKQFQTVVSDLKKTLQKIGARDVLLKRRNFICVDTEKIDCDYYRFLKGDVAAINSYMGEYMTNYSWAELTTGFLFEKSRKE